MLLKNRKVRRPAMYDVPLPAIERVTPADESTVLPQLIHLLQDTVASSTSESGSSVGFLAPLDAVVAQEYWRVVFQDVAQGRRVLYVARDADRIVGSVQLALAPQQNGRHRAEVQKLLVLSSERRRGLGRALMQAVEQAALDLGRTLLVLDTMRGNASERLYRALGYCEAGVIPGYAQSANGTLHSTVIYFKALLPLH